VEISRKDEQSGETRTSSLILVSDRILVKTLESDMPTRENARPSCICLCCIYARLHVFLALQETEAKRDWCWPSSRQIEAGLAALQVPPCQAASRVQALPSLLIFLHRDFFLYIS